MQTLTFNKHNWSGEDITIKVTKDYKFKLFGYDFYMEVVKNDCEYTEFNICSKQFGSHALVKGSYCHSNDSDHLMATMANDSYSYVRTANIWEYDFELAHIVAGVQVLCNII